VSHLSTNQRSGIYVNPPYSANTVTAVMLLAVSEVLGFIETLFSMNDVIVGISLPPIGLTGFMETRFFDQCI